MLFCLKFLQINGRILRRNLHFIETKCHAEKMCFPSMAFFMVLDLFPDTLLACMRCVNFNFVYFWSYPDLFPHTEKRHLSYFSNILQKEKSAEKSALFHLLSLLPWHQYHALNVPRYPWIDNIRWLVSTEIRLWEQISDFPVLGKKSSVNVYSTPICFNDLICDWISGIIISRISLWHHNSRANPRTNALSLTKSEWLTNWKSMLMTK